MNTIHVRPAVSVAAITALALAACGVAGDHQRLSSPTTCEAVADDALLSNGEGVLNTDAMWLDVDGLAKGTCGLDVQLDGLTAPVRVLFDMRPS